MTSIIDVLPHEILAATIDLIASGEHRNESLKACSLVCQTFLHLCRKEIFRSVTLPIHKQSAFAELAQRNPGIVEYVREFEYTPAPKDLKASVSSPIVNLLKRFTKLRSVVIDFKITDDWSKLPSSLRSALLSLMHFPCVISIYLKFIRNFSHLDLLPCTNLRKLRLHNVVFADWDDTTPLITPTKSIILHTLEISNDLAIASVAKMTKTYQVNGASILDLGGLRNITIQAVKLSLATEIFKRFTA